MVFWKRVIRAALFDSRVYEEVEADPRSMGQAATIVLLASLAGGLGAGWPRPRDIVLAPLLTLLGWMVWSALTSLIFAFALLAITSGADY